MHPIIFSFWAKPAVNVCFIPSGNCTSEITCEIEQAKTEILAQIYSLTSRPNAEAVAKVTNSGH